MKNRRVINSFSRKRFFFFRYGAYLFLFFAAWFGLSHVFTAKHIECYTQFGLCDESLAQNLSWLQNYSLLAPLPETKAKTRLSTNPDISKVELYRRLPFTLVAAITLRSPIGAVSSAVLGAAIVSDDTGYLYKQDDSAALPLLLLESDLALSQNITLDQVKALKMLRELSTLTSERSVGKLNQNLLSVTLSSGTEIVLNINSAHESWYPSLQLILARSRIMAKVPRKIDLSFNNSIVTY